MQHLQPQAAPPHSRSQPWPGDIAWPGSPPGPVAGVYRCRCPGGPPNGPAGSDHHTASDSLMTGLRLGRQTSRSHTVFFHARSHLSWYRRRGPPGLSPAHLRCGKQEVQGGPRSGVCRASTRGAGGVDRVWRSDRLPIIQNGHHRLGPGPSRNDFTSHGFSPTHAGAAPADLGPSEVGLGYYMYLCRAMQGISPDSMKARAPSSEGGAATRNIHLASCWRP